LFDDPFARQNIIAPHRYSAFAESAALMGML
jgi:hypothetical protein